MILAGGNFSLLALRQSHQLRLSRAKTKFPVEPERARAYGFVIFVAELIGIHRYAANTGSLMEEMKHLGINPSGFTVTISVERVEADFHPLEQRNAFDVVDRHSVLQSKPGVVGTQRQTAIGRQAPEKDLNTAAGVGFIHLIGIASGGAVELAIADRNRIAAHVENVLTLGPVQFADRQRRGLEF